MFSILSSAMIVLSISFFNVVLSQSDASIEFIAIDQNRTISTRTCPCSNQGICDSSTATCICPSGYLGQQCERNEPTTLCNNVACKNGGVCNILSATTSACWCLLGFHGEFCERRNAASRCTQIQCLNGGMCYEHSPAVSIFAYCLCQPGFTGQLCQTEYFRCPSPGLYIDYYGCAQGSYFYCDSSNQLIQGRCPKGLRFNANKMFCDRASAVTCPDI